MTIGEIKKGLNEICKDYGYETCDGCPFYKGGQCTQKDVDDDMSIAELMECEKLIREHNDMWGISFLRNNK